MKFRTEELLRYLQLMARIFYEEDVTAVASVLLIDLGIRTDTNGFHYLRKAIEMYHAEPTANLTKGIYPEISRFYRAGDGWKPVEQAIRRSLKAAWNERDPEVWEILFPRTKGSRKRCPSNKYFIAQITCIIELYQHCREVSHESVT